MLGGCKCRFLPLGDANSTPPNSVARFRGHFKAGREGEGNEGRVKEKEGKGRGMGENIPTNTFLFSALMTESSHATYQSPASTKPLSAMVLCCVRHIV